LASASRFFLRASMLAGLYGKVQVSAECRVQAIGNILCAIRIYRMYGRSYPSAGSQRISVCDFLSVLGITRRLNGSLRALFENRPFLPTENQRR
jgi:hypothetical protein